MPDQHELDPEVIRQRTIRHRTAHARLVVLDDQGKPLPGADVTVRQTGHKFLFGCNAYVLFSAGDEQLEQGYRRRFIDVLNYATLPFYWSSYEGQQGTTRAAALAQMALWCREHHVATKGHPLAWHECFPAWMAGKSLEEVEALQMARIAREVQGFAGRIDRWDVINESVATPRHQPPNPFVELCGRLGRTELIRRVFQQARQANPQATLVLNDFDVTPECENLLRQCLDAGVDFDVIGIQSHMHVGYWGPAKAWDVCSRFARFGKPLHFTEATLLSGPLKTDSDWHGRHPGWDTTPEGEARQAHEVEEFYRVLFSHPAVEAITWWDLSDHQAWQGAPAGLVRKDMSPKPAYEALMRLVKGEWWTAPTTLRTDAAGRAEFHGFLGPYAAEAAGRRARFRLDRAGEQTVTLRMTKDGPEESVNAGDPP